MANVNAPDKLYVWVQKVLPLVYDDSLSYYEVLAKVVAKLNELINYTENYTVEQIREAISQLAFEALYDAETETIYLTTSVNGGN